MVPFPKKDYLKKDSGKPIPPGFWIGVALVLGLFAWLHGCEGGVAP